MAHKIYTIDVFSNQSFMGNPVAVVFDADDLTNAQMQKIANWTNLSETTFFQKAKSPLADYQLRIFTPMVELPFAGHPTLGSAYAALNKGLITKQKNIIIQECKVGLVEISLNEKIEFKLPKAKFTKLDNSQVNVLNDILATKIDENYIPTIVDVGPKWIIAKVEKHIDILKIKPNFSKMLEYEKKLGATGITIFGNSFDNDAQFEVRSFAPSSNINEDPVCGSGNGSVCAFMLENSIIKTNSNYIARQGRAIGRNGYINARIDENGEIYIGGDCTLSQTGEIMI